MLFVAFVVNNQAGWKVGREGRLLNWNDGLQTNPAKPRSDDMKIAIHV